MATQVTNRNATTYCLALSIFSLSGALIYFVILATEITRLIPGILKIDDDLYIENEITLCKEENAE